MSEVIGVNTTIRPARPNDAPALGRLGALLVRTHHEFDAARFIAATPRTEQGYGSYLASQLASPDVILLVAEQGGEVIGYAYASVEGFDYMALRGPAGVLHDVVVDPTHRRAGAGRLLLDAALAALEARDVPRVVLWTAERNEAAQRLFVRAGFRRTMIEMTRESGGAPTREQSTVAGEGGLPKVVLVAADGALAEIYLHGAHVTSWIPAGHTERLFVSRRSAFRSDSAIRGGVPIVFPQFANEGKLPKHGFARTSRWELVSVSPVGSEVAQATFRLSSSPSTEVFWPYSFVVEFVVAARAQSLDLALTVINNGSSQFTFTSALHTYLSVADVEQTFVRGLQHHRYRDSAAGGVYRDEIAERVGIAGEVDRVYLDVRSPVSVEEPDRVTTVEMDGFTDVVVWNPGSAKCAALSDMEPDGYRRMLCIEAGAIGTPVTVTPGSRWSGAQRLRAR